MEQTVVILKPDTVSRGLIGEIVHRFERKGLKIVAMKMSILKEGMLEEHYAHHKGKPFFKELVEFMASVPSVLLVAEGIDAVEVVRQMAGETSGRKAQPGTIRGDFSMSTQSNIVHASDSISSARKEIERFFSKKEIHSYDRVDMDFVYSREEKK